SLVASTALHCQDQIPLTQLPDLHGVLVADLGETGDVLCTELLHGSFVSVAELQDDHFTEYFLIHIHKVLQSDLGYCTDSLREAKQGSGEQNRCCKDKDQHTRDFPHDNLLPTLRLQINNQSGRR